MKPLNHLTKSLASIGLGLTLVATGAHAESVGWSLNSITVLPGEMFTLDLIGTGFTNSTDGGGLNLSFDAGLLNVTGMVFDPLWTSFYADPGTVDNSTGRVSDLTFATFGTPAASFKIATITFQAKQDVQGTSELALSESFALGGFARLGRNQTVDFTNGSVTVTAVPEAGTVLMFLMGLMPVLGLAAARRKSLA